MSWLTVDGLTGRLLLTGTAKAVHESISSFRASFLVVVGFGTNGSSRSPACGIDLGLASERVYVC